MKMYYLRGMWMRITIPVVTLILVTSCTKKGGSKAKVGTMDDLSSLPEPALIPFREGRWNEEKFEMENRLGLADASDPNKIVITPQFSDAYFVPDEEIYLCERKPSGEGEKDQKNQYAIYDKKGKELLILRSNEELNPFEIDRFRDGLIVFRKDDKEGSGKYGALNLSGKEVIMPQYDALELIGQNLAKGRVKDKWTLIEVSGDKSKELFPPRYSEIKEYISEDLIMVKENDRYGYINTKGEQVIPCQYEGAMPFSEGLAPVAIGKKWGYIDKSGKEIIRPEYEEADMFVNGFARVEKDDHWGFVNAKGELIVSPRYDEVGTFLDGTAPVRMGKDWGCINEKGELFIPLSYQSIIRYPSVGVIAVRKDNKWGFLSFDGKELVSPRYDGFNGFGNNGLAAVKIGEKWGYVDKEGNIVIPAAYDKAFPFMPCTELAVVYQNGKMNYVDKKGNKLLKEDVAGNIAQEFDASDLREDFLSIAFTFEERSHPVLMHPAFRPIYAMKLYGSLFCYMGMDIVKGKDGAESGFVSPKGITFWKDEKPAFMKAMGEWEGKGEFQLISPDKKEVVKIENIWLRISNPRKIEMEGGKKIGVVSIDATASNLGSYSFYLQIKNDKLVSSEELPYYYSLQEYVKALLATRPAELAYSAYSSYFDVEKIKLSVSSLGDNEIELSIELENVENRVYQQGEEFNFRYPKAVLKTTLRPPQEESKRAS